MNILLVEDDPRIADFLLRGLRAEGHQVQRAATGPDPAAPACPACGKPMRKRTASKGPRAGQACRKDRRIAVASFLPSKVAWHATGIGSFPKARSTCSR